MPLDTRKTAHITSKLRTILAGRGQQITMTLRKSDNTTTTLSIYGIWREAVDADPTMNPPSGGVPGAPNAGGQDDIVSEFLAEDITLAQLRSVIYAAPATLLNSEPATRYIPTGITPKGMLPGGDRYIVTWTRQR
jgi:hypothetical protein